VSGDVWDELQRPGPDAVTVDGVEVRRGSRVVLRPGAQADIFDLALAGRVGVVEALEEDAEGRVHVAVTLEDDPGRDLGESRFLGHRFFFSVEEIEPFAGPPSQPGRTRVLVAGIGNVFLGDDGFGVEVARILAGRTFPPEVDIVDYGIRGMDLAYALAHYDTAILVDAAPRGEPPGTLSVLEVDAADDAEVVLETHGMDPVKVLRLATELGGSPERTYVVACEPQVVRSGDPDEDVLVELSPPVRAAVEEAARLVESLVERLLQEARGTATERW
jgi:hydrogenase maturation protease